MRVLLRNVIPPETATMYERVHNRDYWVWLLLSYCVTIGSLLTVIWRLWGMIHTPPPLGQLQTYTTILFPLLIFLLYLSVANLASYGIATGEKGVYLRTFPLIHLWRFIPWDQVLSLSKRDPRSSLTQYVLYVRRGLTPFHYLGGLIFTRSFVQSVTLDVGIKNLEGLIEDIRHHIGTQ